MLQKMILNLFQNSFRLIEKFLPTVAGKWGIKLFFKPRKHQRPVREAQYIKNASIEKIPFQSKYSWQEDNGHHYVFYQWGSGPVVLLVHGWEGRGSQMGPFVKSLVNAGYKVVTFDAVAHGDALGKRTNLPEFADIIADIEKTEGGFEAIIGHSLGGVAAAWAISNGVNASKLVTVGSPASMEFIFAEFARQIGATQTSTDQIAWFIENFSGRKIDEFSLKNILSEHWANSEFKLTENLGHRRILRDEKTILEIIDFIATSQKKKLTECFEESFV